MQFSHKSAIKTGENIFIIFSLLLQLVFVYVELMIKFDSWRFILVKNLIKYKLHQSREMIIQCARRTVTKTRVSWP
jgi:hypothetical protein